MVGVLGFWGWSAPWHGFCRRLGRDRVAAVECAGRLAVLQCWYRAGPASLYRITGRDRGGRFTGCGPARYGIAAPSRLRIGWTVGDVVH